MNTTSSLSPNLQYWIQQHADLTARLTVLQDLDKLMEHDSHESKEIRELIRRTLVFLKYFKPGSEEYPNAIRRAYNFLLNTLETELKTTIPGLVHLIGHSHIDTAWLWTLQETAEKMRPHIFIGIAVDGRISGI